VRLEPPLIVETPTRGCGFRAPTQGHLTAACFPSGEHVRQREGPLQCRLFLWLSWTAVAPLPLFFHTGAALREKGEEENEAWDRGGMAAAQFKYRE